MADGNEQNFVARSKSFIAIRYEMLQRYLFVLNRHENFCLYLQLFRLHPTRIVATKIFRYKLLLNFGRGLHLYVDPSGENFGN